MRTKITSTWTSDEAGIAEVEGTIPESEKAKLMCRYHSGNHPRIVVYHEVPSDREIEFIKELALPKVCHYVLL